MTNNIIKRHNIKIEGNSSATETIIFVHGFGSQQSIWRFILPAFQEKYRIILFDLIGSNFLGKEEFDVQRYRNFQAYAEDLINICEYLQLNQVSIVAHSASCIITALASLTHPHFFKKLIFIGASPRYLNEENYIGGFTEKEVMEMLNSMGKNYSSWINHFTTKAIDDPSQPFLSEEFAQCLLKLSPDIAFMVFKMIILSDYRQQISQVSLPTLIIQPQDDMFVPLEVGFYLHKAMKNSKFQILPTKGHFPQLTHPFILADTIVKYLGETKSRRKTEKKK